MAFEKDHKKEEMTGTEEILQKENEKTAVDSQEENKKKQKTSKTGRNRKTIQLIQNKRAFKKGSYSAALSVIVVAVIVVLNLVVGQIPSKYTQIDISTGKLYTIGDETKNTLKNLKDDVTIYYVVQSGNEDSNIQKLLDQYEENSSKIKVEKVDPVAQPAFIKQYTEDSLSENSLIVVGENRNKVVSYNNLYETELDYSTYQSNVTGFDGEGQITSAITYVVSEDVPVLYYVEGHNEVSVPDSLGDRIEKANLELKSLNLVTADAVPEDAAGILLNSPESDYSADEVKKVTDYLKNGGKAIILTDYVGKNLENYHSILEEYGIEITDGIVVETDADHYVQIPYYIVPTIGASDVTDKMTLGSSNVLLSGCQGFSVAEDVRDTLEIDVVLSPTEDAFVKTSPQDMKTYDKESGDADGPFSVGILISESISSDTTEDTESEKDTSSQKKTQIACFSSSSILDESINSMVSDGNYTLYMNCLKWLMDTDDSEMVSIASKSVSVDYLTVTRGKAVFYAFVLVLVLPVFCLAAGGVICYRRKKR